MVGREQGANQRTRKDEWPVIIEKRDCSPGQEEGVTTADTASATALSKDIKGKLQWACVD